MGSTAKTALIAYDLLILRRGAQAAFSRRRDMVLLALALPLTMLLVWSRTEGIADKAAALPLAAKAALLGLIGFAVAHALAARRRHLRERSIVARQALQGAPAAFHAAFWGAPPLLAAFALFTHGAQASLEAGTSLAACAAGVAAALGSRALAPQLRQLAARRRGSDPRAAVPGLQAGTRRQRIARLLIARAGFRTLPLAANLALFAGSGAIVGFLLPVRASGALAFALAAAGVAAALLIGRAVRQHPPLLRYLLFLGIMPTGAALVPLIPVAVLVAGFVAAAASVGAVPLPWLTGGAAAFLLLLAAAALLRAYHYAAKPRQAAEFALHIEFAAIPAAALIAPPLAPALLAARLWMLHRAATALRHSLR